MSERERIQSRITDIVVAIVRDEVGETGIIYRTPGGKTVPDQSDWSIISWPEPADPLKAIEIARYIEGVSRYKWRTYAEEARGAGLSWLDLADAVGVDKDDTERDIEAFRLVAGEPTSSWREPYVTFKCSSCNQRVRDNGPYGGHPSDCETGHAETCLRFKAEVAQYMATWED